MATPAPSPRSDAQILPAPEQTIREVFLTPRVLDKRSFDEYSETLRQLIREASSHSRSLQASTGDVKSLGEAANKTTRDLQTRVEQAAKFVPLLEQQLARAEKLTKAPIDERAIAAAVQGAIERVILSRIAELDQRTAAATRLISALDDRIERIAEATESAIAPDAIETKIAPALERIVEARSAEFDRRCSLAADRIRDAELAVQRASAAITELSDPEAVRAVVRPLINDAVEATAVELDNRIDAGAHLLEDLKARTAELHATYKDATDPARVSAHVDEHVRALIGDRVTSLNQAAEHAAKTKSTLDSATRDAIAALAKALDTEGACAGLRDAAAKITSDAADDLNTRARLFVDAAVADLQTRATDSRAEAESLATRTAALAQTIADRFREHEDRLTAAQRRTLATIAHAELRSGETVAAFDARVTHAASEADRLSGSDFGRLERVIADAARILSEGDQEGRSLESLVAGANSALTETKFAVRQLDEVRSQADRVRSILGQELLDAAKGVDHLAARRRELDAQLANANTASAQLAADLQHSDQRLADLRAARADADAELNNAARELDSLQFAVAQRLAELNAAADAAFRAAAVAGPEAARAEEIGAALARLTAEAAAVARSLDSLVQRPKPPQPTFLNPARPAA
jgi:hypothetical protein